MTALTYHYIPLPPHELPAEFLSLVPQPFDYTRDVGTTFAMGITVNAAPAGIALASYDPYDLTFDVFYLNILEPYRQLKPGADFVARLQQEGAALGAKNFFIGYRASVDSTPFYEAIIAENKWKGTRPFMVICKYHMPTLNMPWIHNNLSYSEEFEEFLWKDLKPSERAYLNDSTNLESYAHVSPFIDEKTIEPVNSLGLRYQGRVVGWMITHRTDPDTILYKSLYVEKGLEAYRIGPKLVAHAVLRHLASGILTSKFEIPYGQVSTTWRHFVERRLVPYADVVIRLRYGWHDTY